MPATQADGFRSPMLAFPATPGTLPSGSWIAEQKYDGIRWIICITAEGDVRVWSRNGNSQAKYLSAKVRAELLELAPKNGVVILDSEAIIPGGISSDVKDLSNIQKICVTVFDILHYETSDLTGSSWQNRRAVLEALPFRQNGWVTRAPYREVKTWEEVDKIADAIWEAGGEGLILKDTKAKYECGKRRRSFLKIKECQSTQMRIIGFAPSEGAIMQYGDYGTAICQDEDGVVVPVKVLDDDTRAKLNKTASVARVDWHWAEERLISNKKIVFHTSHPWVGRTLWIEYQVRTRDGSYRHPRWDRLEGE